MLAFGISWALWIPAASGTSASLLTLVFLRSLGPSPVAVLFTASGEGRSGLKELLGRLLAWRVGILWYLLVLLGLLTVALVTSIIRSFGSRGPGFGGSHITEGLPTNLILLGFLPAFLISLVFGVPLG